MAGLFTKLLSIGGNKQVKQYEGVVDTINERESIFRDKSDAELRAMTAAFRERYDAGESLDELLPDAFATMREACRRTLGLRHFDVQLIGGIALHEGNIAEMRTGEGKTLVSTLAGYLNALSGENVHIVTVNDYLARRDSEWMGRAYRFLGMDVGLVQNGMQIPQKRESYRADVTYGTNSEFGFDYLRDNMVNQADMRVQRGHHFAIVDEVDSILIDEARTPLIISGAGVKAADTYRKFARAMPGLILDVDYQMDEAKRTINATESGLEKIEGRLGIDDIFADPSGLLPNHLQQALRAQYMYKRDVDYVVVDGQVKIVDEFTGRIMEGRRFSEGLHQALEAKEHVIIREENQTLATITLQNYFRMYEKLSGMTGTAMTEDAEFREIYKLPVVAIPPNKPVIREDLDDLVYRTVPAKFNAVADDVEERHSKGQPCLIGTVSIESSERLSRLLDKRGIKHETLNAKNHEREAGIIAQAGRTGAVTIATNMAGRGTDILLGGNPEGMVNDLLAERGIDPEEATEDQYNDALAEAKKVADHEHEEVVKAGGLAVIGTERHESRRIDNQLRGRSGRQGDPGSTQFYLSLEDDLMRLFGGDRMGSISRIMEKTDIPEDMPITAKLVSKAIENAQHQVETMHFAARKDVLDYDDVMNQQRKAIYEERNAILDGKSMEDTIPSIAQDAVADIVDDNCDPKLASDDWDFEAIDTWVHTMTGQDDFHAADIPADDDVDEIADRTYDYVMGVYRGKEELLGKEAFDALEGQIMLRMIDARWMNHLAYMDYLRTGIGLRAYGQKDPLVEYRREAHEAFGQMTATLYTDFLRTLLRLNIAIQPVPETQAIDEDVSYTDPEASLGSSITAGDPEPSKPEPSEPVVRTPYVKDKDDIFANVGRNDPCPCGSGKKFKKCHGANR